MTRTLAALVLLLLAPPARSHVIPLNPSSCVVQPLELVVPAMAVAAQVAPATAADVLRIAYSVGSSTGQVCPADPVVPQERCATTAPARAFDLAGTAGSLAFPPSFQMHILSSGDLSATDVPIRVTLGGAEATLPFAFTSGLVTAADQVFAGQPIGLDGSLSVVGTAPASAPLPLTGPVVLRLTCQAQPAPDLDQFTLPPEVTRLGGNLTSQATTLHATVRVPGATADTIAGGTAAIQVRVDGRIVLEAAIPGGLAAASRRTLTAQSDTVRLRARMARKGATPSFTLTAQLPAADLAGVSGRPAVEVTWQLAGVVARSTATFRASGKRVHRP